VENLKYFHYLEAANIFLFLGDSGGVSTVFSLACLKKMMISKVLNMIY
jgi:hypothetical protein